MTQILAAKAAAFSDFVSISNIPRTLLTTLSVTPADINADLYAVLLTKELINSKAWITSGYLSGD